MPHFTLLYLYSWAKNLCEEVVDTLMEQADKSVI